MGASPRSALALALALASVACAPEPVPASPTRARAAAPTAPPRPPCPAAPALEWHALALDDAGEERVGDAFAVAGHVLDVDVDLSGPAVVGRLDAEGTAALERHTLALARRTYAGRRADAGAPPARMAVVLDGAVVAATDITTALRGPRFRVPFERREGSLVALGGRLHRAATEDRRCFGDGARE